MRLPIQDTLLGPKTVHSFSFNEGEIIRDILRLHCGSHEIECDPTFSIGGFYERNGIPKPVYRFDILPQLAGVTRASADKLPLPNESIRVLMFDPPFLAGLDRSGHGVMRDRFSSFASIRELWAFYAASLVEFHRVLAPSGVLIFKCQDTVDGGLNKFSHVEVMNQAVRVGFYPKDLLILLARNRIVDVPPERQQHARKFHCYFWVFEKNGKSAHYSAIP